MITARSHTTWSIYKKEVRQSADTATFYIASVVFLLLWEYLFFRNVFLAGEASLRSLFELLPWLFLLLIPAVTMGTVSKESSDGTLEFLLTHPVTNLELLLGKFLAALSYTAMVLLFALPIAASIERHGSLDWGVVLCQYGAGIGMASVLIAFGILISSLVRSQVSALLLIAFGSLLLIISGNEIVTSRAPSGIIPVLSQLSVLTHFNSMIRGVIDTRDIWYFASATILFLSLSFLKLSNRQFGNRKMVYRRYQYWVLGIVVVVLTSIALGSHIPGRLDATNNGLYTLSSGTRTTVSDLKKKLTITLYSSAELPATIQPVQRDVKDILNDYSTLGHGNIVVKYLDPGSSKKIAKEAQARGVQQVQFNTVDKEELKLKKGYFGIAVEVGDKAKSIPYVQNTNDLEYQLTSAVADLTTPHKKKVVFLSGHGEKDPNNDMSLFTTELKKQFSVSTSKLKRRVPSNTSVLVIAGPTESISKSSKSTITDYLEAGGSVMYLLDGAKLNLQQITAEENISNVTNLASRYGIKVNKDVVFDEGANVTATFNSGTQSFQVPYIFWPRLVPSKTHQTTRGLETVVLPWGSSISIDRDKLKSHHLKSTTLLTSTQAGGLQVSPFTIRPQVSFKATERGKEPMAVAASGKLGDAERTSRFVVIGSSTFISDGYLKGTSTPPNIIFGLQAVSWLAEQKAIASIQAKGASVPQLSFKTASQKSFAKYGNIGLAILVTASIAAYRILRRRRLAKRTYSASTIKYPSRRKRRASAK